MANIIKISDEQASELINFDNASPTFDNLTDAAKWAIGSIGSDATSSANRESAVHILINTAEVLIMKATTKSSTTTTLKDKVKKANCEMLRNMKPGQQWAHYVKMAPAAKRYHNKFFDMNNGLVLTIEDIAPDDMLIRR